MIKKDNPKRISFILDENLKHFTEEAQHLAYKLKNPLAGEHIHIVKTFTRELIKASSRLRQVKITKKPPKESLILTTELPSYETQEIQIPLREGPDYTIPTAPIPPPKRKLALETIRLKERQFGKKEPELKKPPKPIKKFTPKRIEEEKITLITSSDTGEEFAYAIKKGIIYEVEEVELTQDDVKVLNSLKPKIEKKKELLQRKAKLIKLVKKIAKKNNVDFKNLDFIKLRYYLIKHLVKFGLIDPLLYDPKISKIICDGPGLKIEIIHDNQELITNLEYNTPKQLNQFLKKIAEKTKQKLTEDEPTLEAEIDNFSFRATLGTEDIPSKYVMERTI